MNNISMNRGFCGSITYMATNWTGLRFGKLVFVGKDPDNPKKWIVQCDCGNRKSMWAGNAKNPRNKGCGCSRKGQVRHGMTGTRTHRIWIGMLSRCHPVYGFARYGKVGIRVCDRWAVFENFVEDMGLCPSETHTIDRLNPEGHYQPGNCRWATRKEQCENRRFRDQRGEKNPRATLTNADAVAIRETYARGGLSQRQVGLMFKVSQAAISRIVRRKSYV